jgi:hypothetical protein
VPTFGLELDDGDVLDDGFVFEPGDPELPEPFDPLDGVTPPLPLPPQPVAIASAKSAIAGATNRRFAMRTSKKSGCTRTRRTAGNQRSHRLSRQLLNAQASRLSPVTKMKKPLQWQRLL